MRRAAHIIAGLPESRVNIVDVGCYTGAVTRDLVAGFPMKDVYSIGVDPILHVPVYAFTHYVQAAIRNCAPTEATFYQYSDPMCSSLLKMTENITHNPEERDKKWFGAHDFERLLNTKVVPVQPLSMIVEQYDLADKRIHFLKIDAQGCDLEVFLSLGRYVKNCLFIQMEQVTSHSEEMVLYIGQTIYEHELPVIQEHGFEQFSVVDYGLAGASPESDVIYINTELRRELGIP